MVDAARPDEHAIERAAACLRSGGLVAFPTETVYGLGAHALDRGAVRRLFEVKERPAHDPLIVHVAGLADVAPLTAGVPQVASALAARFWPGPLTLVLRRAPIVPPEVTAGLDTVAIRVPAHPVARALLLAARIPVAAPSANLFSRPSPTRASHVMDDLAGRIDMVVDAGATGVGVESTVLDLTTDPPTVLRPGAVSVEDLRCVLPDVRLREAPRGQVLPSPGLLEQHYAPRTPLTLYRGEAGAVLTALRREAETARAGGRRVGVLGTRETVAALHATAAAVADLGPETDAGQVASRLYAALRELDAAGLDAILAADVAHDHGLWRAVRDRLQRASTEVIRVS